MELVRGVRGSEFEIIVDPPGEPAANMERDERLAQRVREGLQPPTLRIYQWSRPCISLGRGQLLENLPEELRGKGVPVVQRPTGGGAVLHLLDEWTYTLAMPLSGCLLG